MENFKESETENLYEKYGVPKSVKLPLQNTKPYNENNFNAGMACLAFTVLMILLFAFSFGFSAVVKALDKKGVAIYYATSLIITTILSQGIILGVALLFSKFCRAKLIFGGGYRAKLKGKDVFFILLTTIGLYFVFSPLATIFSGFVESITGEIGIAEIFKEESESVRIALLLLYAYILAPILPAICEELLFRGVIFKGLRQFGNIPATIITSVLFALFHESPIQTVYQFIISVAICLVVIKTNNIKAGMLMHFFNNLFAQIFAVVDGVLIEKSSAIYGVANMILTLLGIAVCVIAVVYFIKYKETEPKLKITYLNEVILPPVYAQGSNEPVFLKRVELVTKIIETKEINPPKRPEEIPENYYFDKKLGWRKKLKKSSKLTAFLLVILGVIIALVNWFMFFKI